MEPTGRSFQFSSEGDRMSAAETQWKRTTTLPLGELSWTVEKRAEN